MELKWLEEWRARRKKRLERQRMARCVVVGEADDVLVDVLIQQMGDLANKASETAPTANEMPHIEAPAHSHTDTSYSHSSTNDVSHSSSSMDSGCCDSGGGHGH